MVELGYKDIAMLEALGWYVPAKTPMDTVRKLNALVREALQTPDFIESLAKNGLQPLHQSPEEFAAMLKRDSASWAAAAKATGFTAED
jgi:tripartite-type tricarboxylate transporter receptor subunit TctC